MDYASIKEESKRAVLEVIEKARLKEGDILVVGCSSSEIRGDSIGKNSDIDCAKAAFEGIYPELKGRGIYLAAQCCEHLNRSIVIEEEAVKPWEDTVNAVPRPHAGGSFAVKCYGEFNRPVILEKMKADAGMDIGDTLIGMHLKEVAVPLRLETKTVGKAHLLCARTRPKFIGGSRTSYDDELAGGEIRK